MTQRRPLLAGPWLEAVLAFVLLALHLSLLAMLHVVSVEPMLYGLGACAGAALTGAYPLVGTAACLMSLLGFLRMPPQDAGPAIYSGLVVIFSCASRRLVRLGMAAVGGYFAFALALTSIDVHGMELVTYMMVWVGLCGLAWLLGVSVRAGRDDERHRAEKALEQQRLQMAAELHDNVAHDLALIIMRTEERRLSAGAPDPDLEFIGTTARRAATHLRGTMRLMRLGQPTDDARLLLRPAVEEAVADLRSEGFDAGLLAQGATEQVPLAVQDALARIAKEAANNVVKHASRDVPCTVILDVSDAAVDLAFTNGIGSQRSTPAGGGLGLVGVKERVDAVGGVVESGPRGSRWLTRVSVPLAG